MVAGIVYELATYVYFKALQDNDASMVVIMFQLIPVFSYIISLILVLLITNMEVQLQMD